MEKFDWKEQLRSDTKLITMIGIFTAIEIILSRLCSISVWNFKIGFSFMPVALVSILLGSAKGG